MAFNRAMGMSYQRAECVLPGFLRFVHQQDGERPVALDEAGTQWARRIEGRKVLTVGNELGVVRIASSSVQ